MSEAFRVTIKSGDGCDQATSLQVVAKSRDEAVKAVREKLGDETIVEADDTPLTLEEAAKSGLVSGKVLLS